MLHYFSLIKVVVNRLHCSGMPLPDDQEQNLRSAFSNKADQEKKPADSAALKVHDEL
jgi:hypothetical protein